MTIPVIILNYNTSADCLKCITFLKQQEKIEIEIVVVDNCSCEDDVIKLRYLCREQSVTLIENKDNRGYNAGNNIGLRYAANKGYKYALIANPDMEFPQTDYLVKMVDTMEKHPNVVACGSDIIGPDGIHQNPMEPDGNWKCSIIWLFEILKRRKTTNIIIHPNSVTDSQYCFKISGCCLLVCIDYVRSKNYFDENVFLYSEEAILAKQIERDNKQIYYLSEVKAIHRHIKSEKGNPIKHIQLWKKSRIYFIKNYSCDTFLGKQISIIVMYLYVTIITSILKMKKI